VTHRDVGSYPAGTLLLWSDLADTTPHLTFTAVLSSTPLPVFLVFCQSGIAVILVAAENKVGPIKTPR
jgi:hypothetical protein